MISDRALWFFENFQGVTVNSLFSLYDPVLKDAVERLYQAWSTAVRHDDQYHDAPSGQVHVFTNPGDLPLPPKRQAVWDEINQARGEMQQALATILERLRADYVEVNLHKTNTKAWKDYRKEQRSVVLDEPAKTKRKPRKKR